MKTNIQEVDEAIKTINSFKFRFEKLVMAFYYHPDLLQTFEDDVQIYVNERSVELISLGVVSKVSTSQLVENEKSFRIFWYVNSSICVNVYINKIAFDSIEDFLIKNSLDSVKEAKSAALLFLP